MILQLSDLHIGAPDGDPEGTSLAPSPTSARSAPPRRGPRLRRPHRARRRGGVRAGPRAARAAGRAAGRPAGQPRPPARAARGVPGAAPRRRDPPAHARLEPPRPRRRRARGGAARPPRRRPGRRRRPPSVVALHHPPLATGMPFLDDIGLDPGDADRLGAITARHGVARIVAGHVHMVTTGLARRDARAHRPEHLARPRAAAPRHARVGARGGARGLRAAPAPRRRAHLTRRDLLAPADAARSGGSCR